MIEISRQECDYCERMTRHERDTHTPNHILHLLISVFTFGAWIPVWIFLSLFPTKGIWRCSHCGEKARGQVKGFWETMGIGLVLAIVMAFFVLFFLGD